MPLKRSNRKNKEPEITIPGGGAILEEISPPCMMTGGRPSPEWVGGGAMHGPVGLEPDRPPETIGNQDPEKTGDDRQTTTMWGAETPRVGNSPSIKTRVNLDTDLAGELSSTVDRNDCSKPHTSRAFGYADTYTKSKTPKRNPRKWDASSVNMHEQRKAHHKFEDRECGISRRSSAAQSENSKYKPVYIKQEPLPDYERENQQLCEQLRLLNDRLSRVESAQRFNSLRPGSVQSAYTGQNDPLSPVPSRRTVRNSPRVPASALNNQDRQRGTRQTSVFFPRASVVPTTRGQPYMRHASLQPRAKVEPQSGLGLVLENARQLNNLPEENWPQETRFTDSSMVLGYRRPILTPVAPDLYNGSTNLQTYQKFVMDRNQCYHSGEWGSESEDGKRNDYDVKGWSIQHLYRRDRGDEIQREHPDMLRGP